MPSTKSDKSWVWVQESASPIQIRGKVAYYDPLPNPMLLKACLKHKTRSPKVWELHIAKNKCSFNEARYRHAFLALIEEAQSTPGRAFLFYGLKRYKSSKSVAWSSNKLHGPMINYTTTKVLYYTNISKDTNKINYYSYDFWSLIFRSMLIGPYTSFNHNYHGYVLL